jgi:hypothetical protein
MERLLETLAGPSSSSRLLCHVEAICIRLKYVANVVTPPHVSHRLKHGVDYAGGLGFLSCRLRHYSLDMPPRRGSISGRWPTANARIPFDVQLLVHFKACSRCQKLERG